MECVTSTLPLKCWWMDHRSVWTGPNRHDLEHRNPFSVSSPCLVPRTHETLVIKSKMAFKSRKIMKLFFNKIQTVVRSIKCMKSVKETVMPQGTKQSTSPGVAAWLRLLCAVAGEWGKSFDGHMVSFQFTKGRNLEHRNCYINSMLISFICDWRCVIVAIVSIVKWPPPPPPPPPAPAPSVHVSFCVPVTTAWHVLWLPPVCV